MGSLSKVTILLAAAAILACPALSHSRDESALRGSPFSDPSRRQEMSGEWQGRKVRHPAESGEADIVVNLNQQFYEFMAEHIEGYGRSQGMNIAVLKGTCGLSAGMLHKKEADIGSFCCPPGETDRLPGLRFHTIGIHPISIITHPDNPVEDLSTDEVRKVFQGTVMNWSELGGDSSLIRVVARLHCRKRPGHWSLILKEPDLFSIEAREVSAIEDMFSLVADTRSSIGYEVVRAGSSYGGNVKALKVNGHHPDELEFLLTGDYPFYRVLSLTTWDEESGESDKSRALVDFVMESIEKDGEKNGIVSVSRLKAAGWRFMGEELVGEPQ